MAQAPIRNSVLMMFRVFKQPVFLGLPKPDRYNLLMRGRRSVAIDLKQQGTI